MGAIAQIEVDLGLDVLVNNAGIGMVALNGPDALRVFDTNDVGIIRVTEAALPLLKESEKPCRRQYLERARLVLGQPRAVAAGLAVPGYRLRREQGGRLDAHAPVRGRCRR